MRSSGAISGRAWAALGTGLGVLGVAVPSFEARAQAPAPRAATMIVLDGSNSMNARLPNDRNFKFVSVRDALRSSLDKLGGADVGLTTFGARRPSDCTDIDVAAPVSSDPARVLEALERFQPRGFSPVAQSLRAAARALPQGAAKPSIVLVLDDLASCRSEDPCAVASALKREMPALSINVVVLGPRAPDLPVLACVVKQTGGQLFQVADGAGIASAIEEALTVAGLDQRQTRPQPEAKGGGAPVPQPRAAIRAPSIQESLGIDASRPGLHLSARLNASSAPLVVPIDWRIWQAEAPRAAEGSGTIQPRQSAPLLVATAPAVSRQLPLGRYEVEARLGLVSVRRAIEVASLGPMPVMLDLNAARLRIDTRSTQGAPAPAETSVEVHAIGETNAPVWIGRGGTHDLVVPPGSYRVRARWGIAVAERVLSVGPGVVADVEAPLDAGLLVVEERSGPAAGGVETRIVVEAEEADRGGARREVHRSAGSRLELPLPAGTYTLSVRRDGAELRERITLKAGETITRAGVLAAARIRVSSRIGAALPKGIPVTYRIERLDVPSVLLQRSGDAEQLLELTPGKYRLEVQVGWQNAIARRELDLSGGPAEQRIELDTGAASIGLKLAGGGVGLGFGEVYWQVFDERGGPVWRTGNPEPTMALLAGRYRVRAETRERAVEQVLDIRAGESRVIEIGR